MEYKFEAKGMWMPGDVTALIKTTLGLDIHNVSTAQDNVNVIDDDDILTAANVKKLQAALLKSVQPDTSVRDVEIKRAKDARRAENSTVIAKALGGDATMDDIKAALRLLVGSV
jgi:hypothetical protein